MAVKRIVTDIGTEKVEETKAFYETLFDLDVVMDFGWVATLSSAIEGPMQISIMTDGGSDAPAPDLSIEVDDVDVIYGKAKAIGAPIEYDLKDEPWAVRRFFTRDPAGKLINVMMHL